MELCTIHVLWIYLILAAADYSWYIYYWNYFSIQPSIQPHHTTLQPSVFGRGAFGGFEAGQTFDLKVSFTWRVKASETSGSDVVKVMYTDSMWRGSVTHFLKEGTCYTAIDVMFTSLVAYHNLTLTLPSNLSHSNYKFPWSFSLVFDFFLAVDSSEQRDDGRYRIRRQLICFLRTGYSKQLEGDVISGNSCFFWRRSSDFTAWVVTKLCQSPAVEFKRRICHQFLRQDMASWHGSFVPGSELPPFPSNRGCSSTQ